MDFPDSTNSFLVDFYFPLQISGTTFTAATLTGSTTITIDDKDWMPYDFFEYEPLWHKKFAAIKYQMEKMWN